jgi:hypothetical protein
MPTFEVTLLVPGHPEQRISVASDQSILDAALRALRRRAAQRLRD